VWEFFWLKSPDWLDPSKPKTFFSVFFILLLRQANPPPPLPVRLSQLEMFQHFYFSALQTLIYFERETIKTLQLFV
jgi:hypothetical protein